MTRKYKLHNYPFTKHCEVCGKPFACTTRGMIRNKKTCSRECITTLAKQNNTFVYETLDVVHCNPSGMCKCGCGQKTSMAKRNIKELGHVKGKPVGYLVGHGPGAPIRDVTGVRFGRLIALRRIEIPRTPTVNRGAVWVCQCRCGNQCEVASSSLLAGHTRSCGCFVRDVLLRRNIKHGHSCRTKITPEYKAYINSRSRCNSPASHYFEHYGGRGIKFLFPTFAAFFAELGMRPSTRHSIDRINNDGNYEAGNVRWATMKEQAKNKRTVGPLTKRIAELEKENALLRAGVAICQ